MWYAGNPALITTTNRTSNIPSGVSLVQNYPNPSNPSTTIEYQLPSRGNVHMSIYNSLGELVRTLIAGETKESGSQTVVWDGRKDAGNPVSSGAYFYHIRVNDQLQAKKMLLLQ
jgi:flagellar hook assembly protein FlgD